MGQSSMGRNMWALCVYCSLFSIAQGQDTPQSATAPASPQRIWRDANGKFEVSRS